MSANPEQSVIDEIDALVNEQMAGGEYAADRRTETIVDDIDRCALCRGAWHGSPWAGVDHDHLGEYDRHNHGRALKCPGAFATGPQRIRYRWQHRHYWPMRRWMGREHVAARMFGNLGNPMRELVDGDPMQWYQRMLRAARDAMDSLTEGDPAMREWQREQRARWFNGEVPNVPPQMQFPRAQFAYVGESQPPRGGEVRGPGGSGSAMAWLDEAYDRLEQLRPRRGAPWLHRHHTEPWRIAIGETGATYPGTTSAPLAPITLPKFYMVPAQGGQQSVTRYSRRGPVLMRYWGSPQAAGTWWELDPSEGPWTDVEVTTTQDEPPRRRRDRSLPPLQRVFIELTAANGLHDNPIGLIALGDFAPGRSGMVHRAFLKSAGDHPPLLYDDERLTNTRQPTSWRRCATSGVHPECLVEEIRGAGHL